MTIDTPWPEPIVEQMQIRAAFHAIMIGMAKDLGFTKGELLHDIALLWSTVPDPSPRTVQ